MTEDESERSLRRDFRELRDSDRRAIPSFQGVLARSSRCAADPVANRSLAWLALALALVTVGLSVVVIRREAGSRQARAVAPAAEELLAWRSPTRDLLQTTGRELTRELPRVGAFDLAYLDPERERTKDVRSTPLSR